MSQLKTNLEYIHDLYLDEYYLVVSVAATTPQTQNKDVVYYVGDYVQCQAFVLHHVNDANFPYDRFEIVPIVEWLEKILEYSEKFDQSKNNHEL